MHVSLVSVEINSLSYYSILSWWYKPGHCQSIWPGLEALDACRHAYYSFEVWVVKKLLRIF